MCTYHFINLPSPFSFPLGWLGSPVLSLSGVGIRATLLTLLLLKSSPSHEVFNVNTVPCWHQLGHLYFPIASITVRYLIFSQCYHFDSSGLTAISQPTSQPSSRVRKFSCSSIYLPPDSSFWEFSPEIGQSISPILGNPEESLSFFLSSCF